MLIPKCKWCWADHQGYGVLRLIDQVGMRNIWNCVACAVWQSTPALDPSEY